MLRERQRDRLGEGGWWCCMSRTRTVLFALALRSRQRQKQASLMSMSTLRGAATWVARRVWGWQMFYFSWASRRDTKHVRCSACLLAEQLQFNRTRRG